jgi:hypothetical protein
LLTEEEKTRIRAEEVFRAEICRDLEKDRPSKHGWERVWELANSSFVLWLLSSVVLSGVTAVYSCRKENLEAETRRSERAKKLDTEIINRIFYALSQAQTDQDLIVNKGEKYRPTDIYNNKCYYLDNKFMRLTGNPNDFSTVPEYSARGFRSLILELRTLVDARELPSLNEALRAYGELTKLASMPPEEDYTQEESLAAATRSTTLLRHKLINARWGDGSEILDRDR